MDGRPVVGYAPVKMVRWDEMTAQLSPAHVVFPLRAPDGQIGYMPVYATLEALRAEWGAECSYMIIRQEPSP